MGKQPTYIAICRHGARLDTSDRDWRSNAERPWDTPLTYGGWIRCQLLGSRILEELGSVKGESDIKQPRKKRKVVIHTSPYLRCLQTAIAIGAGLQEPVSSTHQPTRRQKSSLSKTSIIDEEDEEGTSPASKLVQPDDKITLCIDNYLEEWRCASYFESTVPPPSSEDLTMAAKDYLQIPAEDIKGSELPHSTLEEFSTIDWEAKQTEANAMPTHEKTGLRAMSSGGQSLPKRLRHFSSGADSSGGRPTHPDVLHRGGWATGYIPPIPNYSIAPQDPIPVGYVAHARDACIQPDLEWNSLHPPLDFGDGGPWDEEWGNMHRRVGNGLQKTIAFYENAPDNDSDEEDLVIILVTHQAICNALIRLLTGAPALHDVGLSSLTLAVRHPDTSSQPDQKPTSSPVGRRPSSNAQRRGSFDFGLSSQFSMKIVASTEHLRAGSNPLGLNSPRLGKSPAFASRRMVGAESPEGFTLGESVLWRSSSGQGSGGDESRNVVGRPRPARSQSTRSSAAADAPAVRSQGLWRSESQRKRVEGLWGRNVPAEDVSAKDGSNGRADPEQQLGGAAIQKFTSGESAGVALPHRSVSHHGGALWESGRPTTPGKRRWTSSTQSP